MSEVQAQCVPARRVWWETKGLGFIFLCFLPYRALSRLHKQKQMVGASTFYFFVLAACERCQMGNDKDRNSLPVAQG